MSFALLIAAICSSSGRRRASRSRSGSCRSLMVPPLAVSPRRSLAVARPLRAGRPAGSGRQLRSHPSVRFAMLSSAADALWRDVVVSLRLLRRAPGFALVTIATLALAIGANAVVFGVLNGLILRPLERAEPGNLYGIEHANEHRCTSRIPTIWICATATAASSILPATRLSRPGSTTGRIRRAPGRSRPRATTSTRSASSRISAGSSTRPTSTVPAARRTSCSATATGTPSSTTIRASSGAASGSTSTRSRSSAWRRPTFTARSPFSIPTSTCRS